MLDLWFEKGIKKHFKGEAQIVRYADDFVCMSQNKSYLQDLLYQMEHFLADTLFLQLHSYKVSITTVASGVDFLGWIHFPDHRVVRTVTKRRMLRELRVKANKGEVLQSYLGMLSHGDAHKLQLKVADMVTSSRIA